MSEKIRQISWLCIAISIMALGFMKIPVSSYAVAKKNLSGDAGSIAMLEKKMMSSVGKIRYRRGTVRSVSSSAWKKAKKLKRTADSLVIKRKGWYTFCITTQTGTKKLFKLYFNKKKYIIRMNKRIYLSEGYYYPVPCGKTTDVIDVTNSSLRTGAVVKSNAKADFASQVWKVESAGGKKIRLKNVNSGYYLTCQRKKGMYRAVQKKKSEKNVNQIFTLYDAGGGRSYIKCRGTKLFLHCDNGTIAFSNRKRQKKWKFYWTETEIPASFAVVSGATYPTNLNVGSAFSLKGTVTSRYALTVLNVTVSDTAGKTVLQKTVYPNSCYADLKQIDAYITFGKLQTGTYTYKVVICDAAGRDISVISRSFTVGNITPLTTKLLTYNHALIEKIGHQSNGTALEKKACASYALAYCNAILTGTSPSPHTYWTSETNVDCVWSLGGYKTLSYSTEQEVLQAAAVQLASGKPSILHVTGNTAQHWVTIVGCKKSMLSVNFTASDFVAIDPWDGKVITVSDKYKVKTTYRLGIKS